MTRGYAQWPGFPLPAPGRRTDPLPALAAEPDSITIADAPDHHSQLEELIGHVRRCERWARLDDRIDLSWRLDGNA